MKGAGLKIRSYPEFTTHAQAARARLWQDEADDEEWNAWMDHTYSQSPIGAEDEDDFGAWVDATDSPASTGYHTPIGTPFVDEYTTTDASVMTVRDLRRLNSLEHSAHEIDSIVIRTPSIAQDTTSYLYINPWDDGIVPTERLGYQTNPHDEECDIDPEIDSAMAFSAWESALSRSDPIQDEDKDEDEGEDGAFDAWDGDSQIYIQEFKPAEDAHSPTTQSIGIDSQAFSHKEVPEESPDALEWYTGQDGMVKPAERRSPTWMQRLTGNRPSKSRDR